MKELREIVALAASRPASTFALATLVRATGSSYRRPGARMLVTSDGARAGSLSAGCLEDEVAAVAQEVLASGGARLLEFDTRRRFGCHGTIEIFVEQMSREWLDRVAQNLARRQRFTIATHFDGHEFTQEIEPVIRLLVIGDGPDAEALKEQACLLGWETIAHAGVAECELDARSAAVVATHNYGRDCAALRYLLPLGLRYVGVIGPRRRREELLVDLIDSGTELRSSLFAPAGLDLGGETPEEIALAIVAEIQAVFAGGSGESLRDRKAPIHGWNAPPQAALACELSAQ